MTLPLDAFDAHLSDALHVRALLIPSGKSESDDTRDELRRRLNERNESSYAPRAWFR